MQSLSSDARFLGVDLKPLWQEICHVWQRTTNKTISWWLTPAAPIVVLHADGTQAYWLGDQRQPSGVMAPKNAFVAIELPVESVLVRSLFMPAMRDADMTAAIALEARTSSPFADHDMVWGYQQAGSLKEAPRSVVLAIASRKSIGAYLATQSVRLTEAATPEVWVVAPLTPPIVLPGFGEGARVGFTKKRRHLGYALVLLGVALFVGIAVTPTAQLRLRAVEAVRSYDAAVQRTGTAAQQREALMQSVEKLDGLSQTLVGRIEPLRVLDKLTTLLPDDTALQSFKLQGAKVTISGDTSNVTTLLQTLGEQTGLRDVRSPSAATRMLGAPKESFVIEFNLDPAVFGVVAAVPAAIPTSAASLSAVEVGLQAPAPAAAMPLPAAAVSANSAVLPVPPTGPPAAPAATFGGRATFGGTMPKPSAAPASAASPGVIKS